MSSEFREPLFNHSGFTDARVPLGELLPSIHRWYEHANSEPSFFLQESPNYDSFRRILSSTGYSTLDKHVVLSLRRPRFELTVAGECTLVNEERADEWSRAYLSAFYGENSLFKSVLASVKRALGGGESNLMLAEFDGKTAGTLAIHTHGGYSGVYCVGTVPEFRGKGIATKMLSEAQKFTQKQRTTLVLQTFASDSVENFYLRRGFERAYVKDVLVL